LVIGLGYTKMHGQRNIKKSTSKLYGCAMWRMCFARVNMNLEPRARKVEIHLLYQI